MGGPGGPVCLTTHVFVSVYVNVSCLALLFQKIIRHLEREGLKNIIFTNCVKDENVKQVGCFFFNTLMLLLKNIQETV